MKDHLKVVIKPAELEKVATAIKTIEESIGAYLIALTPKERQTLPKMGEKSETFVSKVLDYCKSNTEFVPPFVDVSEMQRDFKAVEDLEHKARKLRQLLSNIEDTILMAGSEAFVASLSYYNSVKLASKLDVPNAKVIYKDLKHRFEQSHKESTDNAKE